MGRGPVLLSANGQPSPVKGTMNPPLVRRAMLLPLRDHGSTADGPDGGHSSKARAAGRRMRVKTNLKHQLRTPLNHIIGYCELMLEEAADRGGERFAPDLRRIQLRIGAHIGPVVAGIIGRHKYAYDLWGDTVNIASRMESHGIAGAIQVTFNTYEQLKETFNLKLRGPIEVKGKGTTQAYLLIDKKE